MWEHAHGRGFAIVWLVLLASATPAIFAGQAWSADLAALSVRQLGTTSNTSQGSNGRPLPPIVDSSSTSKSGDGNTNAGNVTHASQATTAAIGQVASAPPVPGTYSVLGSPQGNGESYARVVELHNGVLLMTWQPGNPIYRSLDGGKTWTRYSQVVSPIQASSIQPFLYVLDHALGKLSAGAVLLTCNELDATATYIQLYASRDDGLTWEFLSTIANGTLPDPGDDDANSPVEEPSLLQINGTLICVYADERDHDHVKKISAQTSRNGTTWTEPVDVVVRQRQLELVGTPTLARLGDGSIALSYEVIGTNKNDSHAVHVRHAKTYDQLARAPELQPAVPDGKVVLRRAPYIAWTSFGGSNGTLIIGAASTKDILCNTKKGLGTWQLQTTQSHPTYSPGLCVSRKDPSVLYIAAGASFEHNFLDNAPMTLTVSRLPATRPGATHAVQAPSSAAPNSFNSTTPKRPPADPSHVATQQRPANSTTSPGTSGNRPNPSQTTPGSGTSSRPNGVVAEEGTMPVLPDDSNATSLNHNDTRTVVPAIAGNDRSGSDTNNRNRTPSWAPASSGAQQAQQQKMGPTEQQRTPQQPKSDADHEHRFGPFDSPHDDSNDSNAAWDGFQPFAPWRSDGPPPRQRGVASA